MKYDVYLLDVYRVDDDWIENDRWKVGEVDINDSDTSKDILNHLKDVTFKDLSGHTFSAIESSDLRSIFVDYFDNTIEIGSKKNNHRPEILLQAKDV